MSDWDLVLRGGRVVDPESGLDAVADVALAGGRVAQVADGLTAAAGVDVTGLVVTAGFVDLHSHVNDIPGQRLQALDGVTTALELEAGVTPVDAAYRAAAAEGRPVNYGFATSWALARMEAVAGIPLDGRLSTFLGNIASPAWQRPAAPTEINAVLTRLSADLADGALGIGVLAGYAPAADPAEYLQVAALAAEAEVPTFTHARDLVEMMPQTLIDGAEEIVRAAGETGAHMHYCHVNSTSQRHVDRVLGLVGRAQAAGSRVTTEAYPYGSGMTGIGAAFLAPERLAERGLTPSSLTYAPTGERVASEARLRELRQADPGGLVIIQLLDEDDPADRAVLMRSLTFPGSIVASDAMPLTWTAGRARPAGLAAAGDRDHSPAQRRDVRPGAAPAHPRRRVARPGRGAEQVQPVAGPGAAGPGARDAPQGPAAGRRRRRHRGVRPGRDQRPGQLRGQHPAVSRDPARAGQWRLRGAGRRDRTRRPARPPGPGQRPLTARAMRAVILDRFGGPGRAGRANGRGQRWPEVAHLTRRP